MSREQNLTEALSILGISHHRDNTTDADGRHSWFGPDGALLGRFDAHEGWEVLHTSFSTVAIQRVA